MGLDDKIKNAAQDIAGKAKEAIGGFSVIDVESLDAALELARSWPSLGFPGIAVEVRPIVEHRMD